MSVINKKIIDLLSSPYRKQINPSLIKDELGVSIYDAIKIFREITQEYKLKVLPYRGSGFQEIKTTIDEWEFGVDPEEPAVYIEGTLPKEDQRKHWIEKGYKNKLNNLKEYWKKHLSIWYGIIDVIDSQELQITMNENKYADYNDFIHKIQEIIEKADNQSRDEQKCFLGEIGDAFKLVINNQETVKKFVKELAEVVMNSEYFDNDDIKLKCTFHKLSVEDEKRVNFYFRKTINGMWDINSEKITESFRVDSNIKIDKANNNDFKIVILYESTEEDNYSNDDVLYISSEKDGGNASNKKKCMYPIVYTKNKKCIKGKDAKKYFKVTNQ